MRGEMAQIVREIKWSMNIHKITHKQYEERDILGDKRIRMVKMYSAVQLIL